ncbi:GNAT family N-acetyltransferase [Gorillibacterium sp. CAU 1737]|uniref:GNAT family N-acetyltransferase n=1 Tax=Gorillibacterium sp. CAU 1737 TaxID=3140362 RepID=UPI0032617B13
MPARDWSTDTKRYELSSEFSIQSAEPEEWGVYCSVYYNMPYTGFFKEETYANPQRNAFWIYRGDVKIGGVRMSPNVIYHLFFIPPYHDFDKVLRQLKELLTFWSNQAEPIKAFEILPDQVDWFARAGFWPDEFRCRWMQRPTDRFDVIWEDGLRIESLRMEENEAGAKRYIHEEKIAHCDFESYRGGLEATRRRKDSFEDFIPREDPHYTNDILAHASTLVFDKETDQLVANCRLCLQGDGAAVYSIGVIPAYRGRGLASRMLQRALTLLKGDYPLVRLYVMEGNDAESVYVQLGFMPGVQEIQTMVIPAAKEELV